MFLSRIIMVSVVIFACHGNVEGKAQFKSKDGTTQNGKHEEIQKREFHINDEVLVYCMKEWRQGVIIDVFEEKGEVEVIVDRKVKLVRMENVKPYYGNTFSK